MPNRVIRDGLLDSEAVLSLPVEARWLYISILLSADDVGLFEATPFRLARRADVRREHAEKLVQLLADADLVRLYQVDGKAYGFIPRFSQRLQIKRIRHPKPPIALLAGDDDAINKINNLGSKTTVAQPLRTDAHQISTAAQPPEPEPEPEPEEERKAEGVCKAVADTAPRKRSATNTKGSRLPAEWALPKAWGDWSVSELGMRPDAVRVEADKFADYWHSKTGRGATKADWQATWRNWCRNAKPAQQQAETYRERDARLAAEQIARLTGGLAHDKTALRRDPLPFERGYVAPAAPVEIVEGEAHEHRRIAAR